MTKRNEVEPDVQELRVEMLRDFATKHDVARVKESVSELADRQVETQTTVTIFENRLKNIEGTLVEILQFAKKAFWILVTPLLLGGLIGAAYFMLMQVGIL